MSIKQLLIFHFFSFFESHFKIYLTYCFLILVNLLINQNFLIKFASYNLLYLKLRHCFNKKKIILNTNIYN